METLYYDLKLSALIKTLRQRNGFKHLNLADAIGVNRSTYGRMENGESVFTPGQVKILASELQTNHLQLYVLADENLDEQFHNTSFSTILIKTIKLAEGRDERIEFSEAELNFVIEHLKKKYQQKWSEDPSLR
jgi:transcriptional regulator with XRE-family HTH domain